MMLTELPHQSFDCLPLVFRSSEHCLVIRSIAARHNPARAWVDNITLPSVALVWDRAGGLYLAGLPARSEIADSLRNLICDTIVPNAHQRWVPEMEIFYDRPQWEPILKTVLPEDLQPHQALFNSYRLARPRAAQILQAPPDFQIVPINSQLLASHGLAHMEHLTGWILSFYRSLREFLEIGFGYLALAESDKAIASLCITVFVAPAETGQGTDYELGLATAPEYRRRGLAGAVSAACVRHCLAHESTPVWHCWADNLPSARVAERVGYELLRQTPAVRFNTGVEFFGI